MRSIRIVTLLALLAGPPAASRARAADPPAPGSLETKWSEGAADGTRDTSATLEVHAYDSRTFILRESLRATAQAPFLYLLVGETRALLIDTGDVADSSIVPLARVVTNLLPVDAGGPRPLLVVHTHRHLDHRAGDAQFAHRPGVEVVGYDLASVKAYFGLRDWPRDSATIDLGGRTLDVLPTPGHQETHLCFYDRETGLFFSGDMLLPGRLLLDDPDADEASARRVAAFVRDRPVSHVLGGHVEWDTAGREFPWGSRRHPGEHTLALTKADLLALPGVVAGFHGLFARRGPYTLENQAWMLRLLAAAAVLVAVAIVGALVIAVRRLRAGRRHARAATAKR